VDCLGRPARFPIGPFALAAAAGAPVVYTFSTRTGRRRYRFEAVAAGELRYENRRDKQSDLARWVRDFAAQLERRVRAQPRQWCNFYPFWETEER
jgi:predicted LPLAT superfamily acyltransferase